MNNVRHIIRLIVVLLLQLLLFNNLHWLGLCHPYIHILFLLMLPMSLPRWAEMLIGAGVGLCIDCMCSTPGVHIAGCVALCYVRPILVQRLTQNAQRVETNVCSATVGQHQFILISALLTFLYHLIVLWLEAWSMEHVGWLLLSVVLSSLLVECLILLYDYLVSHDQ